jgi:hypothetical protein
MGVSHGNISQMVFCVHDGNAPGVYGHHFRIMERHQTYLQYSELHRDLQAVFAEFFGRELDSGDSFARAGHGNLSADYLSDRACRA